MRSEYEANQALSQGRPSWAIPAPQRATSKAPSSACWACRLVWFATCALWGYVAAQFI